MIDYKKRAEEMHRRAQKAEGRLARVMWWVDEGVKYRTGEAMRKRRWPLDVPHWFLTEAKAEAERGGEAPQLTDDKESHNRARGVDCTS